VRSGVATDVRWTRDTEKNANGVENASLISGMPTKLGSTRVSATVSRSPVS